MNNTQMFNKLKEVGATRVVIRFDGAGDSGAIEDIFVFKGDERIAELCTPIYRALKDVDKQEHQVKAELDWLETYCYDELEKTGIDWYNNDGGFGEMEIDFTSNPATVKLEVNTRYTDYNTYTYNLTEE